jgi:hypothetical protein
MELAEAARQLNTNLGDLARLVDQGLLEAMLMGGELWIVVNEHDVAVIDVAALPERVTERLPEWIPLTQAAQLEGVTYAALYGRVRTDLSVTRWLGRRLMVRSSSCVYSRCL